HQALDDPDALELRGETGQRTQRSRRLERHEPAVQRADQVDRRLAALRFRRQAIDYVLIRFDGDERDTWRVPAEDLLAQSLSLGQLARLAGQQHGSTLTGRG